MERYDYFKLFYNISTLDYDLLTEKLKTKSFKKNDLIIAPGQIQRELYFINRGVQMSFYDAEQKTHVLAFTYSPNLCAIPDSFFLQMPSKYYLTCLTDSTVEYLTFDEIQWLFDQSQEIERLFRRMTESLLIGMINRHIELQSLSIEARFKSFCQRSPHLLHLVPHKYIASYLGIDATNFSKLFNTIKV